MTHLHEVHVGVESIDRYLPIVGEERIRETGELARKMRDYLGQRAIWNLNSTASGGGVVELLRSLLPYARGLGIDARWLVISGSLEFFRVTKRLHHALHGSAGDGSTLGDTERATYEKVLRDNADELASLIQPADIVILHDPQTAGLAPAMMARGATVIWRCHVGTDEMNDEVQRGWRFLAPYLNDVESMVFSRKQYIPDLFNDGRAAVIPPSIDPFSAKNQELDDSTVRAILVHTGLIEGPMGEGLPLFNRGDGSPGRVNRRADVVRLGRAPAWQTPLVVQVSRWDPLKDPAGVIDGFVHYLHGTPDQNTEFLVAGPNVTAIADDPEGAATLDGVISHWRALPHSIRRRIHLACLPMSDVEENGAIVNALQRHASVVVQKSLQEGFGLTVTEAMWKARPILAGSVGGIRDQIEDGVHGLLLQDPTDLGSFARALQRLLSDREWADDLGRRARARPSRVPGTPTSGSVRGTVPAN